MPLYHGFIDLKPCKYTLVIPSSYAVGDFVCPGTLREGSLVED